MELKIINIESNIFTLLNNSNETYDLKLKFYGIDTEPKIGDFIKINDKLLDKTYKEYSKSYMFGPLNEPYGRDIKDENHPDIITLKLKGKTITLKRFFG